MAFFRAILCSVAWLPFVFAVEATAQSRLVEINLKAITVLAGEPDWFAQAIGIADTLTHEGKLRVLPMQSSGCIDAAADVMQVTQVDVALLTSDCVDYAQQQGLLPDAAKKFAYVARVKALPIFIVTRRDVPNLTALAGKRIATGPANSAAFASGELLLGGLGLPFVRVAKSGRDGLEALKAGRADAVLLQGFDALDGALDTKTFHALGLTAPQSSAPSHAPALIDAAELKGLLTDQPSLETVSTAMVLAVYNWPQQSAKAAKIKLFSSSYFASQSTGDAAMQLSASVPGWQRHSTSQKALEALAPDNVPTLQQGDGP
jgi:uncharacterized protein